jgi:hypothetical protein
MQYKDFFRHVEKRAKNKQKEDEKETKIRKAAEKLAEKYDVSSVKALQVIQKRLSGDPTSQILEWKKAENQKQSETKKSVDSVISRLKDETSAPSVGDKVKIEFNEDARGSLTPRQEELNGSKGKVAVRDPFSKGSQRARYTVDLTDSEKGTVNNLTPGEVTKIE